MIDFSRPYGQVYGMPGVGFVQDGIKYKANGQPVDEPKAEVAEVKNPEPHQIHEPEPEPDIFDTVTKREIMDALKYIGSKADPRMKREVLLNQLIQETELD